jgi:hypothetical protein
MMRFLSVKVSQYNSQYCKIFVLGIFCCCLSLLSSYYMNQPDRKQFVFRDGPEFREMPKILVVLFLLSIPEGQVCKESICSEGSHLIRMSGLSKKR